MLEYGGQFAHHFGVSFALLELLFQLLKCGHKGGLVDHSIDDAEILLLNLLYFALVIDVAIEMFASRVLLLWIVLRQLLPMVCLH